MFVLLIINLKFCLLFSHYRVRSDQGVENVDVARLMFAVRGTDGGASLLEKVSTINGETVVLTDKH